MGLLDRDGQVFCLHVGIQHGQSATEKFKISYENVGLNISPYQRILTVKQLVKLRSSYSQLDHDKVFCGMSEDAHTAVTYKLIALSLNIFH